MFLNKVGYYVVHPTKKLLELLDKEPISPGSKMQKWYKPHVWIVSEDPHVTREHEAVHISYLKVVFMLDIIQTTNPPFPQSPLRFIQQILGEPPYDINVLDQWWNFERAGNTNESVFTMEKASAEHFRQIKKTGDEKIDRWLEVEIKAREQDS